ncbi:MAG: hypothetical protein Q8N16_03110 [bacterium]|nr:hypothetical protein [bacterium]
MKTGIRLLSPKARERTLQSVYELLQRGIQENELDSYPTFVEEVRDGNWLVFCLFNKGEPVAARVNDISPLVSTGIAISLFTVINRQWRGKGLFKRLIEAAGVELRRRNPNFLGVLAEMDTSNYGVPAADRLEIFRKVGYQRVDFKYILPPLEDGEKENRSFVLVFLPEPGIKTIPAKTLSAALKIYLSWVDEFADDLGRQIRDEMIERLSRLKRVKLLEL